MMLRHCASQVVRRNGLRRSPLGASRALRGVSPLGGSERHERPFSADAKDVTPLKGWARVRKLFREHGAAFAALYCGGSRGYGVPRGAARDAVAAGPAAVERRERRAVLAEELAHARPPLERRHVLRVGAEGPLVSLRPAERRHAAQRPARAERRPTETVAAHHLARAMAQHHRGRPVLS